MADRWSPLTFSVVTDPELVAENLCMLMVEAPCGETVLTGPVSRAPAPPEAFASLMRAWFEASISWADACREIEAL